MRRALFLILFFGAVRAAEIEFTAEVDRTTVAPGEPVQLVVQVKGTNITRIPRPELPALDGFDNLGSSQSQSTSISIVNGRVTQEQTVSFIYTLVPRRTGELVIGPCRLHYGGTEYTTEPITIRVTKSAAAPPSPAPRPRTPFDLLEPPGTRGEVYLEATVDRTQVYQGEQVTVTWTLYTSGEIATLAVKEPPSLTGFWAQEVYQPQRLEYRERTYRGRRFYAAVVRKTALFPTQTGELTIGRLTLTGEMVSGGFFFSTGAPFEVSSQPIRIQVKPLPGSNRPANFTGGVGRFQVRAEVQPETARGGQPVTLKLTITGSGNLGLLSAPALPEIPGLKTLAPETRDNFEYSSGVLRGTRTFEYPLVPQADGRYRLPELELGFFDPNSGTYYTGRTAALEFIALGVSGRFAAEPAPSGMSVLGSDIRHIKTALRVRPHPLSGLSTRSGLFYPSGVVLLGVGLIVFLRQRRLRTDPVYARRARGRGQALRRLKQAERLLAAHRTAEFYGRLYQTLVQYVGDRFNIESSALTSAELAEQLRRNGVEPAALEELIATLAECQLARFSPGAKPCDPRELLARTRRLVRRL